MGYPVRLYVYDVTQGMASNLAPMLLGRPLDGVWHTGIVVYGHEYFFGGAGISYCLPNGTILGHPTQIADLGETEIPEDMFHEYLIELGNGRFGGNQYHLMNHNCNTFSNEVAQFLTGRSIPDYITNLPSEILATPFGQMIRPFIDSMMMEVSANSATQIGRPADVPPIIAATTEAVHQAPNAIPVVRGDATPSANNLDSSQGRNVSTSATAQPKSDSDGQKPNPKDEMDLD